MVFHRTTSHKQHGPKDEGQWCDTSSIGSTFSKNIGFESQEIDRKIEFKHINKEWCVVPSGGAKARSTTKEHHPHPCRYDEQEQYLTQNHTNNIMSSPRCKETKRDITKARNNNHPMLKNKGYANSTSTENTSSMRQPAQTNHLDVSSALQRTTAKILDSTHKTIRSKTTTSNNGSTRISVCDETTHHNSNNDMETKMGKTVNTTNTRGKSIGRAREKICHEILAPFESGINTKEHSGKKANDSNPNNENDRQQKDANTTNETNNGKESHVNGTVNGSETGNNEKWKGRRGDNNGEQDNNKKGTGDGDEEQASQSTPAFDGEVLQKFVIDFKIRNTPAATIGFIHRAFIKEVLTVAPSTSFVASNKRTIPTPTKITTIESFPSNHLLHQKFFHRVDIRDKVSFTHDVYSSVSAMEIKRRVMPFLQEHDIGMWSEEISNNTKVRVCWVLNAHSKVSFRPLMADKLCKGIDEQKENYGDDNNRLLNQLPKKMHHIEVQTRTVTHQGHQTVACCVMAYKPAAPVIRELVAMLDHDYLGNGTSIVSEAAARELDPGKYIEIIHSNTAFHQNTRTISVKYVHDLYWDVKYRPSENANYTTVREWIMTGSGVVSIEPTKDTETEGRYIILCKAEGFPVFRRILQIMFQTLVKTIEGDEDLKKIALTKYQQYPTIIGPHKIGRYAEKNAKGLLSRIDVPTVPKPAIRPPSNKIEFDFGSAEGFPEIPAGPGVM